MKSIRCLKEIARERARKWREDNPERRRNSDRRYREAHQAKRQEENRRYREANPDKAKEANKQWKKANPGKSNAIGARYRAKKLNATPAWSETEDVKEFYINCPKGYHVDHIFPLQGETVSGLHVLGTLQYLTAAVNLSNSNKVEIRHAGTHLD